MDRSKLVIYAALAGNLGIALSKLGAFAFTGSSAILTEAIHSFVDTGNQGLLLLGLRRAAKPADASHPFGYGMEAYFWSFVVALLIFSLGGAISIWEGSEKVLHPSTIRQPWINLTVLGIAFGFEGATFIVALREFNVRRRDVPLFLSLRRSKDPGLFAVLLEDGAALCGIVIALIGVVASAYLGLVWADGLASIAIGLLLVIIAIFLAIETRSLLTGEAASTRVTEAITGVLAADPRVMPGPQALTMHLGPQEILVGIDLSLQPSLDRSELDAAIRELTQQVQAVDPRITRVFLRRT